MGSGRQKEDREAIEKAGGELLDGPPGVQGRASQAWRSRIWGARDCNELLRSHRVRRSLLARGYIDVRFPFQSLH